MGWQCTLDGHTLDPDSLTVGAWEQLYIAVNRAGLPHAETDIRPAHCPTCRNVIAAFTVALGADITLELAIARVVPMGQLELLDCFSDPEVVAPAPTDDDFVAAQV